MGYHTSNAALAYDMQPQPADYSRAGAAAPSLSPDRPEVARRPSLGVVTGAGLEADQAVSPVFLHVIKVMLVLVALFCAVGSARVALAGATSGILDANATASAKLEADQSKSADLEVMRSVYGSSTRIRDLASSTLGMVEATDGVTVDLSDSSSEGSASSGSSSQAAASAQSGQAASGSSTARAAE